MKNTSLFALITGGLTLACACAAEPATAKTHPPQGNPPPQMDEATGMILPDATLTPRLEQWMERSYGGMICFGMNTFTKTEQVPVPPTVTTYNPPDSLAKNVETWARIYKEAGMTYAVMLSQHSSGFCLWDSKVMFHGKEWSYDVGATSNKTDVVDVFVKACKRYGIEPGLYYCLMESYGDPTVRNPAGMAGYNWFNHVLPDDVFAKTMGQIGELADNNPDNHFFWIDIPSTASRKQLAAIYTLLRSKNPQNVIQFNSHYGWDRNTQIPKAAPGTPVMEAHINEWPCDFLNSEAQYCFGTSQLDNIQKYHGKTLVVGYEHNETIGKDIWFTQPQLRSLDELMNIYAAARRRMPYGSRFLLNLGANADGSLEPNTVAQLMLLKPKIEAFDKEFAEQVKASKANLLQRLASLTMDKPARASGVWENKIQEMGPAAAFDGDSSTRWGGPAGSKSGWLEVDLGKATTVSRAVIQEGWDRTRKFSVQYQVGEEWKDAAAGTTIGNERELKFTPVTAQVFRLNITEAIDVPTIWEFQLFPPSN